MPRHAPFVAALAAGLRAEDADSLRYGLAEEEASG